MYLLLVFRNFETLKENRPFFIGFFKYKNQMLEWSDDFLTSSDLTYKQDENIKQKKVIKRLIKIFKLPPDIQ